MKKRRSEEESAVLASRAERLDVECEAVADDAACGKNLIQQPQYRTLVYLTPKL